MIFIPFFIITIFIFILFAKLKKARPTPLTDLLIGGSFIFSCYALTLWFTATIERWQLALHTPAAHAPTLPSWSILILERLEQIAFFFSLQRLQLGIVYTLPFLLLPLVFAVVRRMQTRRFILLTTATNLSLFFVHVVIDLLLPSGFLSLSIKGAGMLFCYAVALTILLIGAEMMKKERVIGRAITFG